MSPQIRLISVNCGFLRRFQAVFHAVHPLFSDGWEFVGVFVGVFAFEYTAEPTLLCTNLFSFSVRALRFSASLISSKNTTKLLLLPLSTNHFALKSYSNL